MDFSKQYNEFSLEELFHEYISRQPYSEECYFPDMFIRDIHQAYLSEGKVNLPNPLYATWDIVDECNLSCVFCSAAAMHTNETMICSDIALDIARQIVAIGIKYVSIRGGEPTLCKQLPEVIRYLTTSGVFVEVVSNGRHIDELFFQKITGINFNLLRIKISLDSYDARTNDTQRGKESHYYASRAMDKCFSFNMPFRAQMVVTKLNYKDIYETYRYCAKKGAASFGCMLLLPIGRGINSRIKISLNREILLQLLQILDEDTPTVLEKIGLGVDAIKLYQKETIDNFTLEDAVKAGHIKCNGMKTRIYIASNGDVYPCDLLQSDEYYSGNILRDNDFWNCSVAKKLRERNRKNIPICKDCKNYACNMGCPAINQNGGLNSMEPNCKVEL